MIFREESHVSEFMLMTDTCMLLIIFVVMISNVSNDFEAWIVNNHAYVWKFDNTVLIPMKAIQYK